MEYCSAIKNNEILPFATWMDLEGIMLSEISQTERQILFDVTYMWNLKKMQHTSEQNRKAADRLTDTENKQVVSSGEGSLGRGGEVQTTGGKIGYEDVFVQHRAQS